MKKFVVCLLLIIPLIISCTNNKELTGEQEIVILHTNDMHAHIDNFAKLAAYKSELEKIHNNVLLLCAGDLFSGNPYVDYYIDKGFPLIHLMNEVGYDLSVIGNHEFDYGQEILQKRIEQAEFPFICANMEVHNTILEQPEGDRIVNINGIKIYFVGLLETGNEGLPSTHPDKVKGITFKHAFEVLDELKHKAEQNNISIALSHLGIKRDIALTSKTDMFEIIIGGHSHTFLETAIDTNNVTIVQAGDDLNQVGKLILKFDRGNLVSKQYEIIDLSTFSKEDPGIRETIDMYYQNPELSENIATALSDIEGKDELGALFTDAQVTMSDLDFCFQNKGGLRISKIPEGGITAATVYSLDPFGNNLIKMELSPKEIESLIKSSFDRTPNINFLIGGGTYSIITDESKAWKELILLDNTGKALHTDSTYTVGLNSYIATSYTFAHADKGIDLGITTAENIINYLQEAGQVDYSGVVRQEIIMEP